MGSITAVGSWIVPIGLMCSSPPSRSLYLNTTADAAAPTRPTSAPPMATSQELGPEYARAPQEPVGRTPRGAEIEVPPAPLVRRLFLPSPAAALLLPLSHGCACSLVFGDRDRMPRLVEWLALNGATHRGAAQPVPALPPMPHPPRSADRRAWWRCTTCGRRPRAPSAST